jgi:hypothetical protein
MNNKELKDRYDKYRRLYRATGEANKRFEQTIRDMQAQLTTMQANLRNCQNALDLQKTLNRQMGEEHDRKQQEVIEYMNLLKEKLRELGYADFNNLGN